ncbi:hypothetical protein [Aurantiacibacter arachoides]|nr:hypothetical protein [Aurantiacibacter arachoides]GGD56501.1 hypothetical protein GCM10011411_15630 [Aurantiacibacter arachoides]
MTNTNDFAAKIFAAVGALAMTMTLIVSSFANPHATTVVGLLA